MRKTIDYEVRRDWKCSCGAAYDKAPERCTEAKPGDRHHTLSPVENRDADKVFVITEMPARDAARWSVKLLTALINAGVQLPDAIAKAGLGGVALIGFSSISRLDADVANGLMDELMKCVRIRPDSRNRDTIRDLIGDDIEELGTYFTLAREVFALHTGFLQGAASSIPA